MGLAYYNQEHDGGDFVEVDRSLICQPKNYRSICKTVRRH